MVIKKKNPNLVLKRITDKNGVARKVWVNPYKGKSVKRKEKSFDETLKELSNNGVDIRKAEVLDDSEKKKIGEFFNKFDINQYFKHHFDALGYNKQAYDELVVDFRKAVYGQIIFKVKVDDEVTINRTLGFEWNNVHHDSFFIDVEEEQGKGIGRKIMQKSVEMYKDAGMEKIMAMCNGEVGGYAWARMGYKAESFSEVLDVLKGSFKSNKTPKKDKDLIDKVLRNWADKNDVNKDAFPMDLVAGVHDEDGRKVGKDVLMGTAWNGIFDLKDEETLDVFNKYVNKKKNEQG